MPFGNDSFSHPYVDLLSIEQALADYAVLITALRVQMNASDSRVIAFGGRSVCCHNQLYLLLFLVWLGGMMVGASDSEVMSYDSG